MDLRNGYKIKDEKLCSEGTSKVYEKTYKKGVVEGNVTVGESVE